MTDLRPALDAFFRDFGVDATVTLPGVAPAPARVIVATRSVEVVLADGFARMELRTELALRRDQVPAVPRETTIVVGGTTYRVDGIAEEDDEVVRVLVR